MMRTSIVVCISSLFSLVYCCSAAFVTVRHRRVSFTSSSNSKRSVAVLPSLFLCSTDDDDDDSDVIAGHPMSSSSSSSRLSHMILKVPSVDKTVKYWVNKWGGSIVRSSRKSKNHDDDDDDDDRLMSAFVGLGNYYDSDGSEEDKTKTGLTSSFCLELVGTTSNSGTNFKLGNALEYIGVSMLMGLQKPLPPPPSPPPQQQQSSDDNDNSAEEAEPNGIKVKPVASAPGDYFARIVFKAKDLLATEDFYTNVLGMHTAAKDESQLCLRYKPDVAEDDEKKKGDNSSSSSSNGMPTTLVFEVINKDDEYEEQVIEIGNCFDHLAIVTKANIDEQYDRIIAQNQQVMQDDEPAAATAATAAGVPIFMKPVDMFGSRIMGVIDTNGYKIVLASDE